MIHRAYDFHIISQIDTFFNHSYALPHIQTACLLFILLISNGALDLIRDCFHMTVRIIMERRSDCSAVIVSKNHNKPASEMSRCVLDAAKLMFIDYIPCNTDYEQIANTCGKNTFRNCP